MDVSNAPAADHHRPIRRFDHACHLNERESRDSQWTRTRLEGSEPLGSPLKANQDNDGTIRKLLFDGCNR